MAHSSAKNFAAVIDGCGMGWFCVRLRLTAGGEIGLAASEAVKPAGDPDRARTVSANSA